MRRSLSDNIIYGIFLTGLSLAVSSGLFAQTEVIADGRLQTILEQHVAYNAMSKTYRGYRIKVAKFTGENAKNQAFDLKRQLSEIFPSHRTYVIFDEPFFNVKTGDFTSRLDAYALLTKIKPQISTAVIVQDYVNAPVISKEDLQLPEYYEDDLENEFGE
ncbi:MAG: SPOR domain-containing protein [Bacteroidales bacterium]|nr:SPOR domain-containing protein [Bacteroidales bacterium]